MGRRYDVLVRHDVASWETSRRIHNISMADPATWVSRRDHGFMVKTLVVDDDPDVLDLVASLLRRDGHDVTTSVDGREAHDLLTGGEFDLCVLDHELPGMTGLEVAAAARATDRPTRFLLVSGLTRLRHVQPAQVDRHVEKPFDSTELLRVVRELIDT